MSKGVHMATRTRTRRRRRLSRSTGMAVAAGVLMLATCSGLVLTWVAASWDGWVIVLSLVTALLGLALGLLIALDDPNSALFDVERIDMDDDGSRNSVGYQPGR